MGELIQFVIDYGYLVVFFGILIEQMGIPLPSNLVLIVAGAVVGLGKLDFVSVVLLAVFACLAGNAVWYYIGRIRGYRVLGFLCRISLEPDRCVQNSKELFLRHGARSLLAAKFIPGFSIFAPPLAGATKMNLARFLWYDSAGSILWVGIFVGLGWLFSDQLETVAVYAGNLGKWSFVILILGLAGYFGWKMRARRRFIKKLRVARIKPEELNSRLAKSEQIFIVDLRDTLDFDANPRVIPTAVRISPDEIEQRHEELPRDQDVILYCT